MIKTWFAGVQATDLSKHTEPYEKAKGSLEHKKRKYNPFLRKR